MEPKDILEQARRLIRDHAGDDADKWWYANRYVFARLQLDERRTKTGIKRDLLATQENCPACGEPLAGASGLHLHRLDSTRGYREGNCALMHPDCHRAHHSARAEVEEGEPEAGTGMVRRSRRYDDKPYLYWWDITPGQAAPTGGDEAIEFCKKDTGERCVVPADVLGNYLLPERQTTRGSGNWGVRVLRDRPDVLAFEPGSKSQEWLFLSVVWLSDQEED